MLASHLVTVSVSGVASVIAARALGAHGRGMAATALAGPAIVTQLLVLGLGLANVYFVARGEVDVRQAVGTSLGVALGVGSLAAAVYALLAIRFDQTLFGGLPRAYILVGALTVPITLAVNYAGTMLGLQRARLWSLISVAKAVSTLVLYVVLLLLLGLGPLSAVLTAVLVGAIALGLLLIATRRWGRWTFSPAYALRGIRFGAKGDVANLVAFLGYRLDLLIVTALLGFTAAGHYVVAFSAAELLWLLPNAVGTVLFPRVASTSQVAGDCSVETTARLTRVVLSLSLMLGVLGGVLAPIVIPLVFSSGFQASVAPLELLIPGVVLFGAGVVLTSDLAGRGRVGVAAFAGAVGLALMVLLDLLTIPRFGLPAAAAASSLSYAVVFLLVARIFSRITGARFRSYTVLRGSDLSELRTRVAIRLVRKPAGRFRRPAGGRLTLRHREIERGAL